MKIYDQPEKLLQTLIRFNTTNPPGNEAACIRYLAGTFPGSRYRNQTWSPKTRSAPILSRAWMGDGSRPVCCCKGMSMS